MRWFIFVVALVACGKSEDVPIKPFGFRGPMKPIDAGAAIVVAPDGPPPRHPTGDHGVWVADGDPAHSKDHHVVACFGSVCNGPVGYDPATGIATLAFTVDADVEVRVPGETLKDGAVWKFDLVTAMANERMDGNPTGRITASVPIAVYRGDTKLDNVALTLDVASIATERFRAATKGKAVAFARDKTSSYPKDVIARMHRYDAENADSYYVFDAVPKPAYLGDVDFVAIEDNVSREASPCDYYDSSGNKVQKSRFMYDVKVVIYDRRTGKLVASHVVASPTPPCKSTIMSDESLSKSVDDATVVRWETSILRAHPGVFEPAPVIAALGAPGTGVKEGETPDLPSKAALLAAKVGVTQAIGFNFDDMSDSASGALDGANVTIYELRMPEKTESGSMAFGTRAGMAAAVRFDHDTDPKRAKTILDAMLAKAPNVAAMFAAGQALVGGTYDDKPEDYEQAWSSYMSKDDASGMMHVLRIDRSQDPDKKLACKSDAKHAVCVELDEGNPRPILGRL